MQAGAGKEFMERPRAKGMCSLLGNMPRARNKIVSVSLQFLRKKKFLLIVFPHPVPQDGSPFNKH